VVEGFFDDGLLEEAELCGGGDGFLFEGGEEAGV
jgi:hypothetical protein